MGWLEQWKKKRRSSSYTSQQHTYGIYCPRSLQTSLQLGDFRFLRAIGHGFASTVFEAQHVPSKTHCVVKVCMKTRLNADEMRRIRREVKNHSQVYHRHILTFYAAFEDASAFYLVMEYALQGDLYTYIKKQYAGKVQLHRFIYFILQPLLHALAYLHSTGIIHRDIKPENILVDHQSIIRLCDFGLSIQSYNERPRSVVGTLEYMAPEVLQSRTDSTAFTQKVDVWAIGVLTYECLTGQSPFAGKSDEEIKRKILGREVALERIHNPTLRTFVELCLQTDPKLRPSVQELLQHDALHPDVWTRRPEEECEEMQCVKRSFSFT
jgi:aurora kinase, other